MERLTPTVEARTNRRIIRYRADRKCPLCGHADQQYLFVRHGAPVYCCANCQLTGLYPQPNRAEIDNFYAGQNPVSFNTNQAQSYTEQEAARSYLQMLKKHKIAPSNLLLIAPKDHPFAEVAAQAGFQIETSLDIYELSETSLPCQHYGAVVLLFQLEKAAQPLEILQQVQAALQPGGLLFMVTPSLDSWSAQFFRGQWTEWRPENLYYFNSQTIQAALLRTGFAQIRINPDRRRYSLEHLYRRAKAYPKTSLTRSIQMAYQLVPTGLTTRLRLRLPASGIVITARHDTLKTRPLLSIVLPAFNEKNTIEQTLQAVLDKELPGMDKEVIVVESNSQDGTRELLLKYQAHPQVKLILEDRPRGKGRAVRTGFEHATGDFIMIQDADQEYDVNDYDALLEPLRDYSQAFVLGSRHLKGWKMRQFNDQPGISTFYNIGHVLFTGLVNVFYRQKMKDPFTMYKVFRRDCLYDLKFECNRFDFDFELVIKLLRKGYVPLEIPVNYTARSFSEGKKVSTFRDPVTWVRALVKYRFAPIYLDGEIENRKSKT